jgi:pyruvate kinase
MLADRRVKIVATIGPATSSMENLEKAIKAGMNVARLNFSHGTHDQHREVIRCLRELSHQLRAPVTILQDLQGPKIRVGKFETGSIELIRGQQVVVTARDIVGKEGLIPTDFKELPRSCQPGSKILLDDGLLELVVISIDADDVRCEVVYGGTLKDRKGINLPGAKLPIECMTEKDFKDLEFGLEHDVDYIALSFVRHGDDLRKLRALINKKNPATKLIAKIEMLEALQHLEEIIRLSDAVMVARGDLAVEIGQSQLPGVQKKIIKMANVLGTPVITATQMLDSMVHNPRPTRAEITDVANAVLDGTDAVMLSAESASGKYPFKCIQTMHNIILEVEKGGEVFNKVTLDDEFLSVPEALGASAVLTAMKLDASAIVCLTTTGKTASIISGFRPKARLIAVTNIVSTLNRLELVWGISTFSIQDYEDFQDVLDQIEKVLLAYGMVKPGDKIILTLGVPVRGRGKTNSLQIHTVGSKVVDKLPELELPLRCQVRIPEY